MSGREDEDQEDTRDTGALLAKLHSVHATEWLSEEQENRIFARIMNEIGWEMAGSREPVLVIRPWLVAAGTAAAIALIAVLVVCAVIHSGIA